MAKILHSLLNVASDVFVSMEMTSIHFQWASIKTNILLPTNNPAKSIGILDHGFQGQGQGLSGAPSGLFLYMRHWYDFPFLWLLMNAKPSLTNQSFWQFVLSK